MEPLADVKRVLIWLCLCPADKNTTRMEQSIYYASSFTIIAVDVYAMIASVNFILNFMHTDVENSLYATAQIMALLSACIFATYLLVHGCLIIFFVSICLHHLAFYRIFQNYLRTFNHSKRDQTDNFRKLIQFHNSVKG